MTGDYHDLVRQLRSELEWAVRTGLVDTGEVALDAPQVADPVPPPAANAAPQFSSSPPRVVDAPTPEPERAPRRTLEMVETELGDCRRCKLSGLGRTNIVFGVGHPDADLMFIGEGPGADEDRLGEPFVGRAGQLLTKIIEGMGLQRGDVYIANVVKCRPPGNRDPEPDEVQECEPFLLQQIEVIRPKIIVTLGKWASQTILRNKTPITRLRGQWSEYNGIRVMPTYHPAYLLRNPAEKRPVWEDMKAVLRALGQEIPARGQQ